MIKEDYVSFEIAKLLKEKGFDEPCRAYYTESGNISYSEMPNTFNETKRWYSCSTLQMVMKWLREVHDIYIDISIYVIAKDLRKYNTNVYYKKHKNDSMYLGIHLTKEYSKYEEACEAAIKYVLENLI